MKNQVDVTFHPSWWNKHAEIDFDEKFFFDADYRIKADMKMRRILYEYFGDYGIGEENPSPRPILFSDLIASGFLYSQLLGCEVIFAKDAPPVVCAANLTEEQVEELTVPDLATSELWQKIEKQITYFLDRFGYVESAINLMGIQNVAIDLRGQELLVDYYVDPELAHKLLDVVTWLCIKTGKRLYEVSNVVSGGVTSIIKQVLPSVYLTSNCSVTMISNQTYCDYLLKYDTMLAENFSEFGIHHCGSNMENVIEGYLKVPNLKFLEIGAGSDLQAVAEAIKRSGREDIISCIRYSPVKLMEADCASIQMEVNQAIKAFGSDQNLCFSCVGIDASIKIEKVREYLSVFRGTGE